MVFCFFFTVLMKTGYKTISFNYLVITSLANMTLLMFVIGYLHLSCRASCFGERSFGKLWHQLFPYVVISKPATDLCWTCQRLYREIGSTSNLPEALKAAKLKKLQGHLELAQQERRMYQQMVEACKTACTADNRALGASQPCSYDNPCHYSFDFAQQVHLPHDPMQPGPVYFVCPRKVGIFDICCEGLPRQFNFLVDESHCMSKGSIAVISHLHFFFEQYGLGVHVEAAVRGGRSP